MLPNRKGDTETPQRIYINALYRSESIAVSISKSAGYIFFFLSFFVCVCVFLFEVGLLVNNVRRLVHKMSTVNYTETIQESRFMASQSAHKYINQRNEIGKQQN